MSVLYTYCISLYTCLPNTISDFKKKFFCANKTWLTQNTAHSHNPTEEEEYLKEDRLCSDVNIRLSSSWAASADGEQRPETRDQAKRADAQKHPKHKSMTSPPLPRKDVRRLTALK